MYVVRIDIEDSAPDFKAFERRPDAERRFWSAARKVWDRELNGTALFEVKAAGARQAVEAVKAGDKNLVHLLEKEPIDLKIDINMDDIFPNADRT